MFKHIVLFSLDSSAFQDEKAKKAQLEIIKKELEVLPSVIKCLTDLKVYFNENPKESYDFMLEAILPSAEKLDCYALHPEHIRIAEEFVKPYLKSRACVDFTL